MRISSSLPVGEGTRVLRSRFRHNVGTGSLIELWVSSTLGVNMRTDLIGTNALQVALERLDIRVEEDADLPYEGELRIVDRQFVIFLDRGASTEGKHFTLAHELGHASLALISAELDQTQDHIEILCDLFAAELLAPVGALRKLVDECSLSGILRQASRNFGVSRSTACKRISEEFGVAAGFVGTASGCHVSAGHHPGWLDWEKSVAELAGRAEGTTVTRELPHRWSLEVTGKDSHVAYVAGPAVRLHEPGRTRPLS